MKLFSTQLLLIAAAATAVVSAQQTSFVPAGKYVLDEQGSADGQPLASLTSLTVNADGSITGVQVMRTLQSFNKVFVTGTAVTNADQSVTLTLAYSYVDTNGDSQSAGESFNLLPTQSNQFIASRANNGISSIGTLNPAAASTTSTMKGAFVLAENGLSGTYAGLGELTFDGNGNTTGFELIQATGVSSKYVVSGLVAGAVDGFSPMSIQLPSTDSDGNPTTTLGNYLLLATATDVKAIRTDAGFANIAQLTQHTTTATAH